MPVDQVDPLFAENDVLSITLTAPIEQLTDETDKDSRVKGSILVNGANNEPQSIAVEFGVRGNNRLKKNVCRFPPLRVYFPDSDSEGNMAKTIFDNQTKLKLATQCSFRNLKYQDYLLSEYLAYRILNILTPDSFRVRLLKILYVEVGTGEELRTSYGFFIEDKERLAHRIGVNSLSIIETSATELDSEHMNLVSLFQLLIGNVDWSATSGGTGDCCHNFKLFQNPGDDILAIPYDFDLTGIVNANYGKPDRAMRLKTMKDRRYRGYCRNNIFLEKNIALFMSRKEKIMKELENLNMLRKNQKKASLNYINSFYRIINDPKRVDRVIKKFCHKSHMIEVSY